MLKPGMFISDRYEIIDKVGSGGMADVYKARDQRLNRFVAIKVLKPEYSSDKSFVNKFRGEAQSAACLSHPNIVNVYDVGDDSGLHFIVMELVEGITLKRFIERKGKLAVKEAVGIAIQIAQGMEAAHDNHIIHRDIKPQNIIISRDGKVKVTDFGIAKATTSNTITSNAMGSVHYLSPEQARGGYSDEKSDIYSLGVTMYEMLSGKVPFAGDNTVSVALLHIQGEAMPLRDLDPAIPVSVDKIVQKCMQKRPERRYHSASELIADLKRAIANPDGDFVKIPAFAASDSPTINISDDISKIKNGTFLEEDDMRPTKNLTPGVAADEDEEELDTVDSKVEKVFLIGTIVAAVVLMIVIISLVAWFLSSKVGKDKNEENTDDPVVEVSVTPEPEATVAPTQAAEATDTYIIPDVLGLTKDDAIKELKQRDPDVFIDWGTEEYSNEYEKGEVMAQYPEGGKTRTKGDKVILTISAGKESFPLDDVSNLTEAQAEIKLTEKNLKMERVWEYNDEYDSGKVIRTEPERGTMVTAGTTIKVIISNGPEDTKVAVPNLLGKTEAEADTELQNFHLIKGTVDWDYSDVYPEGKVMSQSYSAGLKVERNTAIDIIISKGPKPEPDVPKSYKGSVTIDFNPLSDFDDEDAHEIIVEVEQDGYPAYEVYNSTHTVWDFPMPLIIKDIISDSGTPGTAKLYIDGDLFVIPGETHAATWTVEFEVME